MIMKKKGNRRGRQKKYTARYNYTKKTKKPQGITKLHSSRNSATSRSKPQSKHSSIDCFQSN